MPLTPGAALIRDRLAERRSELAEECRDTMDVTAAVLHELHERLYGRAGELAADHSPRYRRKQLAGERALSLAGLVYLILHGGDACVPALDMLARAAGRITVPIRRAGEDSVNAGNARLLVTLGRFEETLAGALEDGVLTERERRDLLARLSSLRETVECLEPVLTRGSA